MELRLKNVYLSIILLSSSAAFCGVMGPVGDTMMSEGPKEGPYFGVGVGGSFVNYQLTTNNYTNDLTINSVSNSGNTVGNVYLGYGYTLYNIFLGAEIGTVFPSRSTTINGRPGVSVTNYTYTDTLSVKDYVSLDLLPGYRFEPNWLVYARVGIDFGELSISQPYNVVAQTQSFNASNNVIAGRFGAGLTYAVLQHIGISLDYYYTDYQNVNSIWPLYTINFSDKTSSNYFGASILYTM